MQRTIICVCVLLYFAYNEASENPIRKYQKGTRNPSNYNPRSEFEQRYNIRLNRDENNDPNLPDHNIPNKPNPTLDIVDEYTQTAAAKILVALFAGLFTSIITSLISLMLTSKVSIFLVCLTSATFSILTFSKSSDYGILAKTLGVITLILLRRVKTANFFSNFIKFLTASMNLSTRKNYPPTDNPWSYKEVPGDPNYIPFNMYSTILSVMLISSYIGSNAVRPIPLFPNWIGALISAVFSGYACTFRDSRGDLLRYIGNSIVNCFNTFMQTSNEVNLWPKVNKVTGKSMAYFIKIDSKYKIIEKIKFLLAFIISKISSMSNR